MANTIVDDNFRKIKRANPVETGNIDPELLRVRPTLMMRISELSLANFKVKYKCQH